MINALLAPLLAIFRDARQWLSGLAGRSPAGGRTTALTADPKTRWLIDCIIARAIPRD